MKFSEILFFFKGNKLVCFRKNLPYKKSYVGKVELLNRKSKLSQKSMKISVRNCPESYLGMAVTYIT